MTINHLRANAVAYLALAVAATTGSAYAAGQLANGSVTKAKLAKNAVTSPKIKNSAIKSVDVKDGSLTTADLAAGVLPVLPKGLVMSASPGNEDPAATPDQPNARTFVFTTGGQSYVEFGYAGLGLHCSALNPFFGLYIDGKPVLGTRQAAPPQGAERAVVGGAVISTTPGTHTAGIGLDCPGGNLDGLTQLDPRFFVLSTQP